jgi:hydrogenase maturation protein HypF
VYRLAGELGLAGHVVNDAEGVLVELEGAADVIDRFLARLQPEAPPLARIESVGVELLMPIGRRTFEIRQSQSAGKIDTPVAPDSATCHDCLGEMLDPQDRRWRYPFINCTNCGPRFTIVRGIPYDRATTTMDAFTMCAQCRAEYEDPCDRRFHAQPNACPRCGPALSLISPTGLRVAQGREDDPVRAAARALLDGCIIAVKGIGGYHLACRADDETTVASLRARKHREDKPFAVMAGGLADAGRLAELSPTAESLLCCAERPIVLAPRRGDAHVAPSLAPGTPEIGVMLPYSPLHHLLLADTGVPLVMTSGNASDEPIAFEDADALRRLGSIADLLLVHDRPIQTRTDDSVVRAVYIAGRTRRTTLRRSRGYVPASIPLPAAGALPILACGAELKSTFCFARGGRAWVSHHIGDLANYETLRSFTDGIEHFKRLFELEPQIVAHDMHPEYLSTKYAHESGAVRLVAVQHHHAHLAACLAEHGERGPAVAAIFDGSGYGPDGTVWGGELLFGDTLSCQRVGSLSPVRLPGGERAITEPWRMACSWLAASQTGVPPIPPTLAGQVEPGLWAQVARLARSQTLAPVTTSAGRLFDALAALCGICARVNYEGQAAIELEAACDPGVRALYPIVVRHPSERSGARRDGAANSTDGGGDRGAGARIEIDPRETIAAALADVLAGVRVGAIAARFHNTLAAATVESLAVAAAEHDCATVVLAGGVFQNRRLLEAVASGARDAGLRALVPETLPLGDGAISFGQATVAAHLAAEPPTLGPVAPHAPAPLPRRAAP